MNKKIKNNMIKNWKSFNESKSGKPGANIPGSKKLSITSEEVGLFADEPALQKLLFDYKVSLFDDSVWYWEDDQETLDILDQYLEI
jgi:hypothetical protein